MQICKCKGVKEKVKPMKNSGVPEHLDISLSGGGKEAVCLSELLRAAVRNNALVLVCSYVKGNHTENQWRKPGAQRRCYFLFAIGNETDGDEEVFVVV